MLCQFQGTVVEGKLQSMDVSVNMFQNGKYLIVLQSFSDGNINEYGLSVGYFKYHKDTVIFTDVFYRYSLIFLRNENELQPIKTFPWMSGRLISYGNEFDETNINISNNPTNYYKPLVYKDNNQRYKLYYREYENNDYSVVLKKGNHYICKIDDLIVSEGKFIYNGKYVKFYDNYLNFSFIGTVGYNNLCVGFFPLENSCLLLKR